MPLSAFAVMVLVILVLSLILVLWVVVLISGWIKARKRVKQILRVDMARREIKLRELHLKERRAAEHEQSDLYFSQWEAYINELPGDRSTDH